jgi:membrane protein insertase Oxa1/YidC/SpoIIIJ
MTLAYKQNSYNSDRQMVKQEIKKYFEKNGFNPNKIIVND